MPAKPVWLLKIPEIVAMLESFNVPVVDRASVERLFGLRRRNSASVSLVKRRPRSISAEETLKRSSPATARRVMASRTAPGTSSAMSLCGGAPAGTKTTCSRPNCAQASEAMARWPT